jgi:hypothetical protein
MHFLERSLLKICQNMIPWTISDSRFFCSSASDICQNKYLQFPPSRTIFPCVRFLYDMENLITAENAWQPTWVCYNTSGCAMNMINSELLQFKNLTCWEGFDSKTWSDQYSRIQQTFASCSLLSGSIECISPMFRCGAACLSPYRRFDRQWDCLDLKDEESISVCDLNLNDRYEFGYSCMERKYMLSDPFDYIFQGKCFHRDDLTCRLLRGDINLPDMPIPFGELCNGLDWWHHGEDEAFCSRWPFTCNSLYTRCDGTWNCNDGSDELNCSTTDPLHRLGNCSAFEHYCVQEGKGKTAKFGCISPNNLGKIRCLGEGSRQRDKHSTSFRCTKCTGVSISSCNDLNIQLARVCDGTMDCSSFEDELTCPWASQSPCSEQGMFACKNGTCISMKYRCNKREDCIEYGEDEWFCGLQSRYDLVQPYGNWHFVTEKSEKTTNIPLDYCHRGLFVYPKQCFCPPNYEGDWCQFQTERISVVLQIVTDAYFKSDTVFKFLLSLQYSEQVIRRAFTWIRILKR